MVANFSFTKIYPLELTDSKPTSPEVKTVKNEVPP